jgi:hypothetical protein
MAQRARAPALESTGGAIGKGAPAPASSKSPATVAAVMALYMGKRMQIVFACT